MALSSGSFASAADMLLSVGGFQFSVPVTSVREARFRGVVPQAYDFSCGSAAIATLLTYHYRRPVREEEVFQAMFAGGDQDVIRRNGFSLLDMKGYLAGQGLVANGYRETLDKLRDVGIPAIVLINVNGYRHFVVITGVDDRTVTIADSAAGVRVIEREPFGRIWNGLLFVVESEMQVARPSFNTADSARLRPKVALDGPLVPRETLALPAWTLPRPGDF